MKLLPTGWDSSVRPVGSTGRFEMPVAKAATMAIRSSHLRLADSKCCAASMFRHYRTSLVIS
jgi:hypothetical protein